MGTATKMRKRGTGKSRTTQGPRSKKEIRLAKWFMGKDLEENLLSEIKDGIWVEDEMGFFVFANDRAAQTLGYESAETLKGKHWTEVVVAEEHSHIQQQWNQRKGGMNSTYQTLLRRTDGVVVPTLVSATALHEGGTYYGSVNLLIDYTEQEQIKERMNQAEGLRALGEMAVGVAHDFNNLLAAILGRAQLLKLRLSQYKGPERRQSSVYLQDGLTLIERAALDGAEIVRRIQDYTHATGEEEYVRVYMDEIVRDVIELTRPRWKSKAEADGIRVEVQEDRRHLPPVSGNPSELREVVTNLVLNAIDAMPHGGALTVKTETDRRINQIHIQDTGVGIPSENLERVFQPFFTTKKSSSSGLGLSVSYGIIRRHGGNLKVKSELGMGSTFTIQLPVSLEALEESEAERPPRAGRLARILVIEDEDRIRDNLRETLALAGHTVTLADNAKQGIALFKKGEYDLVFTDLSMPEISGWEVAKIIKAKDPEVLVALVTGWGLKMDGERLGEKGIDLVISKPFQVNRVLNLVVEAVETKLQKAGVKSQKSA